MTGDREQLERELSQHLAESAAAPRSDAAARVRACVAATPQRGAWRVRVGTAARSPGWARAGALAAVAAGALVVGIYLGQVGLPIQIGPSGSPSADVDASAPPTPGGPWVEPAAYTYVLDTACGERSLIGRFRVTVVNGRTTAFEELGQPPRGVFTVDDIPTLGDLLAELEQARRDGADIARLEVDPMDGHPVEIEIDWNEAYIDDEACYAITEYVVRGQPSETPAPSEPSSMSFAVWERVDMPDPAPGVFGGGTPSTVVAFDGGYVAVGTIFTECCAEGDPAANVGVVWTSSDGRDWQVAQVGTTFDHATLGQVVANGGRLVATGVTADPLEVGPTGAPIPAAWISDDGRQWRRVVGPAPTAVLPSGDGFVGVASQAIGQTGRDIVRFMASADGLEWREVATEEVERLIGLAAGPGGRLLVVAVERGADIIAWRSDDGMSWEGPTVVATDASASPAIGLSAAAAWRGDFVVVGQRDDPARGSIGLAWTSRDGLVWAEHEIGSVDGETLTGVFAVGHAVLAVGDSVTSGATADIMVWVSEDGARWVRVPDQAAFGGINNHIDSVIETSDGRLALAVGRRWDPESGHPVPQAWLASSVPMVWLQPTTQRGAEVGDEQPFQMGHCGLRSPIDFDGSLWAPTDQDPSSLAFDSATGTITLLEPDQARFVSGGGGSVTLERLDGAAAYPLCD